MSYSYYVSCRSMKTDMLKYKAFGPFTTREMAEQCVIELAGTGKFHELKVEKEHPPGNHLDEILVVRTQPGFSAPVSNRLLRGKICSLHMRSENDLSPRFEDRRRTHVDVTMVVEEDING